MAEMTALAAPARARGPKRSAAEPAFRALTFASALGVLAVLGGVVAALVAGSLPALRAFGFGFVVNDIWNPVTEQFGERPMRPAVPVRMRHLAAV